MIVDPRQITLVPAADPTGHSQPCEEAVLQRDSGPVHTGIFFFQHGGQLLKVAHGNPAPSDQAPQFFELDVNGRIVIQEL